MHPPLLLVALVVGLVGCSSRPAPDDEPAATTGSASARASLPGAPTSEGAAVATVAAAPSASSLAGSDLRRAFSALDVLRREGTSMSDLRRSTAPEDRKRCDVRRLALQRRLIGAVERAQAAPPPLAELARAAHDDLHLCVACDPDPGPGGSDAGCKRAALVLAEARDRLDGGSGEPSPSPRSR